MKCFLVGIRIDLLLLLLILNMGWGTRGQDYDEPDLYDYSLIEEFGPSDPELGQSDPVLGQPNPELGQSDPEPDQYYPESVEYFQETAQYYRELDQSEHGSLNDRKAKKANEYGLFNRRFDWNVSDPELTKVKKTWLRRDKKTIRQNRRAEQLAKPSDIIDTRNKVYKVINVSAPQCGQVINRRIVNGKLAAQGAYPWIALMLRNKSVKNLTISVGSNDSNNGTKYQISRLIMHQRFNAKNMYNSDICLLKTALPIKMSGTVSPICLPSGLYSESQAETLMVAGWGATSYFGKKIPTQLNEVKLNIITPKECLNKFKQRKIKVFRSQICTWNKKKDACKGDSGGPALTYEQDRAVLLGIVSGGIGCANQYPGVYTKVSYFLQWIKHTIDVNQNLKKRQDEPEGWGAALDSALDEPIFG